MSQDQNTPAPGTITLPIPKGFDLADIRNALPARVELNITPPRPEPYRIGPDDGCVPGAPEVQANNLGEVSREAIRSALRRCGRPSTVDMNAPLDEQTDVGMRGVSRVRLRHRF